MPYIPGKRIYHCSEVSDWTEEDYARREADDAYKHEHLSLMEQVFHDWKERRHLQRFKKQFWQGTINRYGEKCAACGDTKDLCLDHKTPISKGGLTDGDNLQFLCRRCNSKKKDMLYYEWLRALREGKP